MEKYVRKYSKIYKNALLANDFSDVEKRIKSEILKDTPKPGGGNSSNQMTKEKLRGMSSQERYKFSVEHPEEYKQIYGGNE